MKKNTKMYSTAIAAALATSALVTAVPTQAETVKFKDVDSSNQFYDYITDLANRGIISGYGDDTFRPTLDIRRDHASKIIAQVLALNTKDVVNPEFKDVPVNHPQYGEIAALKAAGIISGDGLGSFLPEKSLTRGEMAKIIANAFDLEVPAGTATPFTDVTGNIFEEYITALYVNEVTKGKGNNKFDPNGKVTRGELAAFVARAEQVVAGEIVEKATKVDSIDGDTIVVNGEILVLTEELKAVFNEDNAAALKNAKVELVIRYKDAQVASLAPVANNTQGEVIGINLVELSNANTSFNAGGYVIPTVTVTANGVTISNASVATFTVAKGATATVKNTIVGTVTVEGTLVIGEESAASEIIVKGDAKITVAKDAKIEKIVLEEGKTLKDVITNYDEVKEQLADVKVETVKPGTIPSTPSTGGGSGNAGGGSGNSGGSTNFTITETANVLVDNLVSNLSAQYLKVGTFDKSKFEFNFYDNLTTMEDVKVEIEKDTNNTVLETALLNSIPSNASHYANLLDIKKITVDGVELVTNPFVTNPTISLAAAKDAIKAQLTEAKIAAVLEDITGLNHDTAKATNLATFLGNGKEFEIVVTFNSSNTSYSKTVKLVK